MFNIIKLNEKDNIGIAPMDIPQNININYRIRSIDNIPYGHKISLKKIKSGDFIFKYGQIIGIYNQNIEPCEHVHSHNMGYSDFKREYTRNNFKNDIIINQIVRELINIMVKDVIFTTNKNLRKYKPKSIIDIYNQDNKIKVYKSDCRVMGDYIFIYDSKGDLVDKIGYVDKED